MRRLVAVGLAGLVACQAPADDDDTLDDDDDVVVDDDDVVSPDDELTLGEEIVCSEPVDGPERFFEDGVARGLDRALSDPGAVDELLAYGHGGSTVAQDLEGDGDIDLVFGRLDGPPDIYLNDGQARFSRLEAELALPTERRFETTSVSGVDVDDDGRVDLLLGNGGWFLLFRGEGDGAFAAYEELHIEAEQPRKEFLTHAWGDPDGDNDLDLLLPSTSMGQGEGDPELILFQDAGSWDDPLLLDNGVGTTTLLGLFTDVDSDHDQDVFIPSDLGPPSTLWENDGGVFTEVASAVGTDIVMAAMGIDAADINGDGLLDYCMTDVGPLRCLQSDASGIYLEPGPGLGLTPSDWVGQAGTVGWSFDFADFDADGRLDAAQSSGPFPEEDIGNDIDFFDWPDLLWFGDDDGRFADVTADVGFGDIGNNVGLVTADFDGDGFLDIVTAGPLRPPSLFMNRCSDGGWLLVDLVGPLGNVEGIGAAVEVRAGDHRQLREVQTLRGLSQGPSEVHFGVGARDRVDRVTVRWTDGTTSSFEDVPTRRRVTIAHPSRVE